MSQGPGVIFDVDIAVVSPQIGSDRFEERVMLTELAMSVDERIEPLPFNKKTLTIMILFFSHLPLFKTFILCHSPLWES